MIDVGQFNCLATYPMSPCVTVIHGCVTVTVSQSLGPLIPLSTAEAIEPAPRFQSGPQVMSQALTSLQSTGGGSHRDRHSAPTRWYQ